jgi:peptidyl-prolyl cis-trans isomerase C
MNGGKTILAGLVSLVILVETGVLVRAQTAPGKKADVVATVNGQAITQADLDWAIKQAGPVALRLSQEQRKQYRMQVLGALIDERLMQQFLARETQPVPAEEVDKKMAELRRGLQAQNKSMEEFCKNLHKSEAQVRQDLADQLRWQRYSRSRITEQQARQYYEEYRDFFDKVIVRASHIVLRLSPKATPAEVEQARQKLNTIREEIIAGKISFAEAARKYSQDATASKGGDVGRFPRLFVLDEAFARPAFALKVNEISEVIRTDFGLHLITVTERQPGQPSDYAKIKEAVYHMCAEELLQKILDEQRNKAKVELHVQ